VDPRDQPREAQRREAQRHEQIGPALAHVVEAGGKLIADRIDLAREQVRETIGTSAAKGGLAVGGGALLALAWGLLLAAVVAAFVEAGISPAGSLALGALVTAALGGALVFAATRVGARRTTEKKEAKERKQETRIAEARARVARVERRVGPAPLRPLPEGGAG
jgi:hypothetical protein